MCIYTYIIVSSITLSDPTENDSVVGLRPNARGPGLVTFGPDRVKQFCENKNFALKVGLGREELQGIFYKKSHEIKIKDLTDTVPYFCPPQLTYK